MMKLVSKGIRTGSSSNSGPQLLGLDILLAHSSNRVDELIHGLAIEQPPEVEQGRLAAP